MSDFWESISIVLSIAVVAAFILIGGWMIGSAIAHTNRTDHERQFACIDRGGHWEYLSGNGLVCKK